jgi:hypothetical protein
MKEQSICWKIYTTDISSLTSAAFKEVFSKKRAKESENNYVMNLKRHGLSPRANYTDPATAACRRSDCQLLRIEGATWSS